MFSGVLHPIVHCIRVSCMANQTNISFRVPQELSDQLDELASKASRSKSNYIRLVLQAHVDKAAR